MSFKDDSIFGSGGHFVLRALNFGRGSYVENLCEIILKLGQQFRKTENKSEKLL